MRCLIERNPSLVLIMEFNPTYLNANAAADFLDQLGRLRILRSAIIDDDQRQLAVGPKAAMLKRLLGGETTCNLLATRDRSCLATCSSRRMVPGGTPWHLERVRL